jgi:hypothetical protein
VALQIDPVAADAQRVVDLEPVRPPCAGGQVVAGLVVDVEANEVAWPLGR